MPTTFSLFTFPLASLEKAVLSASNQLAWRSLILQSCSGKINEDSLKELHSFLLTDYVATKTSDAPTDFISKVQQACQSSDPVAAFKNLNIPEVSKLGRKRKEEKDGICFVQVIIFHFFSFHFCS